MENTSVGALYRNQKKEKFSYLLVDDSSFMLKNVERVINLLGGNVIAKALNGQEAVDHYKKHKPDIITMDITMPGMNGIEAVKEIMKINSSAVIVMVSALGHKEKVKEAILSGAKHFIVKPFKLAEAAKIIASVIKKSYKGVYEK